MHDRAIYTAATNKFFPSVLNLLGSLRVRYPAHPPVFVYDLGLSYLFRQELAQLPKVTVMTMPHFVSFWKQCYTWKPYIFAHPKARLNFYMDAGTQVERSMEGIFNAIERDDYFCIGQGVVLRDVMPEEYQFLFPIKPEFYSHPIMAAGLFGFKANSRITPSITEFYTAARAGLCLGYTTSEPQKNRGLNASTILRTCAVFRYDTSVFNMILRKNLGNFTVHDSIQYAGYLRPDEHPEQVLWNFHMNYNTLQFLKASYLYRRPSMLARVNRILIKLFLYVRRLNFFLKGIKHGS